MTTDVEEYGKVSVKLKQVLPVPELACNLMSISVKQLAQNRMRVTFNKNGAEIYENQLGDLVVVGKLRNNMYVINLTMEPDKYTVCEVSYESTTKEINKQLWHQRHLPYK